MAQPRRYRRRSSKNRMGLRVTPLVLGAFGLICLCCISFLMFKNLTKVPILNAAARLDSSSIKQPVPTDEGKENKAATKVEPPKAETSEIVVHIDGAVKQPGVYKITADKARLQDAVDLAGGLVEDADLSQINLAAPLSDGQKFHIPKIGEVAATASQPAASGTGAAADAGSSSGKININTATVEEFDALPGVGPSTAKRIVSDRDKNGPFSSVEDLMRVTGIGEKKFENLKDSIYV